MDQHHNDNSSTQTDPRAEFYKRLQAECEWACRGGSLPAIADAMKYCAEANMPPPPWLIDANATLVSRQMLVRTGAVNLIRDKPGGSRIKNIMHDGIWSTVTRGMSGG
jgi:hypothetical protein